MPSVPTHFTGSKLEVAALNAWIALARATDSVGAVLHRRLAAERVTETQFGVLEALLHLGPLTQCVLARKLLTSPGNLVLVLDNLERRGLVARERRTDDRRAVNVNLTAGGRALISRLFPGHAKAVATALSVLSPDEIEGLRGLCRKLGLGQKDG